LTGAPLEPSKLTAKTKRLTQTLADADSISFDISETYVTVNRIAGQEKDPLIKFRVLGHWDLKPQINADGTETQLWVKNATHQAKWQKREYVELDPANVLKIKADDATLHQLYAKTNLL